MWGRVAAAALAIVLLGGCSSGKKDDAGSVQPPTTTTAAPASCGPLSGPAASTDATTAAGDFDGDGRADRLLTYRVSAGGAWRIREELAAGGGAETELPATADGVKAVGGTQLDVGPAQAAFAVVGRGTGGTALGLFVLRQCKLERVTLGGKPAEFPVGSAATSRAGLACQVPGLVAYSASTSDGKFYQASTVGYLLVGVILDEVHRSTSTIGADDPALGPYGAFTCGPLKL
jgi:hypothetical protein